MKNSIIKNKNTHIVFVEKTPFKVCVISNDFERYTVRQCSNKEELLCHVLRVDYKKGIEFYSKKNFKDYYIIMNGNNVDFPIRKKTCKRLIVK